MSIQRLNPAEPPQLWTTCLHGDKSRASRCPTRDLLLGAIPGEGVGPEVIAASLEVLQAVASATGLTLQVREGGAIGRDAERQCGQVLTRDVVEFCHEIFDAGGAVLCGPGGGRFVYDARMAFDLFFKISPLQKINGLTDICRLKPEWVRDLDILVVRENCGGAYQGIWRETDEAAHHEFSYSAAGVRRFLTAAARLSASRSRHLTVVWKESGVPGISRLWQRCMAEVAETENVTFSMVDIDLMSYRLISEPSAFDVIATPNMFGDVLGDLGAVLLGARGISFSGNYSADGHRAIYQTNHGAAYDLAGQQVANPAGQIFSAAMMLRESFGLWREAAAVEKAVQTVWKNGYRTRDVAVSGCRVVRTGELAAMVAEQVHGQLGRESSAAAYS
ncbi:3-isopropylmalate dehydrogenase [Phragmitibacter flavus]|uniref:3-isopropylmalate dehydrogenase n=1 Tax=Phragmitibacter flavus TaxID=2576071 RepID=A0A5R8KE64_9BACT|nr:isocitrate/isopropylmalate family dehydrogenase [Phragmitibacter flavus]TLD70547.1 3-isopropylmalate dehydrogenase [Phragmitibacter flavus]